MTRLTKERKYSLITLDIAERDDVDEKVVHVCADRMRAVPSRSDAPAAAGAVSTDPSSGHTHDASQTEVSEAGSTQVVASAVTSVEEKPLSGDEVSEEDFEGEVPFARLRLIVLGCLVLLVIGFVIYNLMGH